MKGLAKPQDNHSKMTSKQKKLKLKLLVKLEKKKPIYLEMLNNNST
jgi:hypothetical protein